LNSPEQAIIDLVCRARFDALPDAAVAAAKCFIADTVGVGLSGSRVPFTSSLRSVAQQWGGAGQARIWSTGESVPAPTAAMVNAYQIHNQEFDCLHEPAVVHAMATVLSSLIAYCEQREQSAGPVDGKSLILAVCVAVEVASVLGAAAREPMRFFRPGVCGALGAAMGIAVLAGFDEKRSKDLLGITYSQAGGTMQAHLEGSPTLPMQIAFNARNVLTAVDLVGAGLEGPHDVISGPFGFYALFEIGADPVAAFADFGNSWQITRLSHKPFPTGRAAHGGLDGIARAQASNGFAVEDIEHIEVLAPPLILRLVDRPASADMQANYAKLCMGYIAATWLLTGAVDVTDFSPENIADPARQALASRFSMGANDCTDPNALAPQTVVVTLADGTVLREELPSVLGSPERPLSAGQQLAKFRRCCASAQPALAAAQIEQLHEQLMQLEQLNSVSSLVDGMIA
jgi:aconitate decarboxylase